MTKYKREVVPIGKGVDPMMGVVCLLDLLNQRLADIELSIQLSAGVLDHIASTGYDPVYGARPLKRAIENLIENPLAEEVLRGSYLAGDAITLELDATHGLVFGKLMIGLDQAVV